MPNDAGAAGAELCGVRLTTLCLTMKANPDRENAANANITELNCRQPVRAWLRRRYVLIVSFPLFGIF